MKRRLVPVIFPLIVAACAVGPDFERPPVPAGKTLEAPPTISDQRFDRQADIQADWWRLYRSAALDKLIAEALQHNADLAAAQAALKVAQEAAAANEGVFYPNLQGSFQAIRQKDPTGSVSSTSASGVPQLNLFTPQVSVSYSPDLWGGNRRSQESADALAMAQNFQTEATYLTLIGNVAVAAINEAALRGQVADCQRIVELARESLDILKHQLKVGQVAEADMLAQEQVLAQAEQTLYPLAQKLDQQRHQLSALLGRMPADVSWDPVEIKDLTLPADLPSAVPSKLVEQRPDIRMAEANLQSASAQIGVAIANRLPNITLDAAAGSTATKIQDLFKPGNGLWNFSATLTQPLFDGFSLLHREREARAAYDQAAAQYRGTVITAFENVADSLNALKFDADSLKSARVADAAAWRSFEIAKKQYQVGQIPYLALAAAEQAALQTRIVRVQAEANRFEDSAALLQALGGGWWNRKTASES